MTGILLKVTVLHQKDILALIATLLLTLVCSRLRMRINADTKQEQIKSRD